MARIPSHVVEGTWHKFVQEVGFFNLTLYPDGWLTESGPPADKSWEGVYERPDDHTLITQIGPYRTVYVPMEGDTMLYGIETRVDDPTYRAYVMLVLKVTVT